MTIRIIEKAIIEADIVQGAKVDHEAEIDTTLMKVDDIIENMMARIVNPPEMMSMIADVETHLLGEFRGRAPTPLDLYLILK